MITVRGFPHLWEGSSVVKIASGFEMLGIWGYCRLEIKGAGLEVILSRASGRVAWTFNCNFLLDSVSDFFFRGSRGYIESVMDFGVSIEVLGIRIHCSGIKFKGGSKFESLEFQGLGT